MIIGKVGKPVGEWLWQNGKKAAAWVWERGRAVVVPVAEAGGGMLGRKRPGEVKGQHPIWDQW